MRDVLRSSMVLVLATAALAAKIGARDNDKPTSGIQFSGGKVEELLLADPESQGSNSTYLGEFAVKRAGRLIHCEDWRFTVHRVPESWAIRKTERGRCNE